MRTVHIGIEKGAEIVDSEGASVGKVHEIIYNENQEITFLVVQKGLVFKHDIAIPHDAIGKVENGQVCLSVPKDSLSAMLKPEREETVESVTDEVKVRSSTT